MIDIAKKRLPTPLMLVLVYVSFCGMNWYSARGTMAYVGETSSLPGWFANDVFAFILGGLLPFAVYAFLWSLIFRSPAARRHEGYQKIGYGLHFSMIAANLVLFAFKFSYLAFPLAAGIVNTFIDPIVTIGFVALYLWYAFKLEYVEKPYFRAVEQQVMTFYITVYGILTVINIVMAVV